MGFFDDDWDYEPDDNGTGRAVGLAIIAIMLIFALYAVTIAAVLGVVICILAWVFYAGRELATKSKHKKQFQKQWWQKNYSLYGAVTPNELMGRKAREDCSKAFHQVWDMYEAEMKKQEPGIVKTGKKAAVILSVAVVAMTAAAMVGINVSEGIETSRKAEMAVQADMSLHDCPASEYLENFDSRTHFSFSDAVEKQADTEPGGILAVGNAGITSMEMELGTKDEMDIIPCFVELLDIRTGDMGKDMMYYVGESHIFPSDEEEIDDYQYAFVQFILPPDYKNYPGAAAVRRIEEPEVSTSLAVNTGEGFQETDGSGFECITYFFDQKNGKPLDGYFAVRFPKDENSYGLSFSFNGSQYYCSLTL